MSSSRKRVAVVAALWQLALANAQDTVSCSFTGVEEIAEIYIDGVDVFSSVRPRTCPKVGTQPCLVDFDDTSSSTSKHTIAVKVVDENGADECLNKGFAFSCSSTNGDSSWNQIASDTSFVSVASTTASDWYEFDFDDSSWGAATVMETQLDLGVDGDYDVIWGDCVTTGFFRKTFCEDQDNDDLCTADDPCPEDPTNDADSDGLCGAVDTCPNDANNDADMDGICDSSDSCLGDELNDGDTDGICDSQDSCLNDSLNDIDDDGLCGVNDSCPKDPLNDADNDGICDTVDSCLNDAENLDDDFDGVCDDVDTCLDDPENVDADADSICDSVDTCLDDNTNVDADNDNVCDAVDSCLDDAENLDSDSDNVCDSVDPCPADAADVDDDNDGICDVEDSCPDDDDNDVDGDGECTDELVIGCVYDEWVLGPDSAGTLSEGENGVTLTGTETAGSSEATCNVDTSSNTLRRKLQQVLADYDELELQASAFGRHLEEDDDFCQYDARIGSGNFSATPLLRIEHPDDEPESEHYNGYTRTEFVTPEQAAGLTLRMTAHTSSSLSSCTLVYYRVVGVPRVSGQPIDPSGTEPPAEAAEPGNNWWWWLLIAVAVVIVVIVIAVVVTQKQKQKKSEADEESSVVEGAGGGNDSDANDLESAPNTPDMSDSDDVRVDFPYDDAAAGGAAAAAAGAVSDDDSTTIEEEDTGAEALVQEIVTAVDKKSDPERVKNEGF